MRQVIFLPHLNLNMKRLLYISLLLFTCFLKAQNTISYTSTCLKVDTITNFYLEDAKKLNFRFIHRSNNTYKDSIALNRSITNNFHGALLAVYNATNMPARDSIVTLLNIHCTDPYMHDILIRADSTLQWMKNIRDNVIPTGYNTIDSLLNKHYLKKFAYVSSIFGSFANLILKSDTALNTLALERFVKTLPGVQTAAYDFRGLDGSNIEDTVNSSFHWFRYSYGWGDCNSGCYFHKYWQFRVHNDCSVEYGGSYGFPLNVGIKDEEIVFDGVKIYPNPVKDKLNVEFPSDEKNIQLSISNALGQTVYADELESSVDLGFLPAGIYFIKLQRNTSYKVVKIIKE